MQQGGRGLRWAVLGLPLQGGQGLRAAARLLQALGRAGQRGAGQGAAGVRLEQSEIGLGGPAGIGEPLLDPRQSQQGVIGHRRACQVGVLEMGQGLGEAVVAQQNRSRRQPSQTRGGAAWVGGRHRFQGGHVDQGAEDGLSQGRLGRVGGPAFDPGVVRVRRLRPGGGGEGEQAEAGIGPRLHRTQGNGITPARIRTSSSKK